MYHYTECGLPNVWLANGYIEKATPYGKTVAVHDADALLQLLAAQLACKKGGLAPKELRFMRTLLGLSQEALGNLLGVSEQSVSLWERNSRIPKSADGIVRLLVVEKLNSNATVSEIIDRINTVDRLVNQKIVVTEKRKKWTCKVESDHEAVTT